ncbi:MAG: PAS domain S-box protein [Bacteroidales bacterium]|nr:PAS domain S-box protein [Bacteroidales bacterium]
MNFIPESKLKELLSDELDFLFMVNMDGDILELNLAVTSILDYSANELKGKSLLTAYSSEDKEKVSIMIPLVMKGDISSCPYPFITKAGETIPVDTQFYIGWWNEENVIAAVSTNLSAESFSKGLFYSIFNGSKVMMAISTFDHDILFNVNRSFMEATEYSLEELSGKSVQELELFNDDAEREKIHKQFKEEGRAEGEITLKAKSGKLIVCLFSIEEIKIRENTYMLSAATDITQRKLMENKLEYLNRQQKLLTDVAELLNKPGDFDDIINTVLKLIGEHSNVSRVYIFENTADEQFTNNTYEWCNEGIAGKKEYLQMLRFNKVPSFRKLLNEEGRIFSENIQNLPDDLATAFAPMQIKSVLIYPIYLQNRLWGTVGFDECLQNKVWEKDEINLLLTVTKDITNALERKRYLNQFKESEQRLSLALNGAKEGMWDWNLQTNEVYFSDTCSTMLGYSPNELFNRGFKWQELIHPDDFPKVSEVFENHLKGYTDYYENVYRIKDSSGKWKWVLDHGKVIERDKENKAIRAIGTHIDVSKQKKVEEQLQELLVTKDKLFSIISHDLRGPIGSFMQIIELLTSDLQVNPDMQADLLNELKDMSKNTFYLLENLLNWSRSQRSDIVYNPRSIIINELINDNISLLSPAAGQKSIRIQFESQAKQAVFADFDMINLVIRNLLSNAIKFTRTGGLITITISEKNGFIETTVEDNGVGIPQEIADKLFTDNQFHTTYGTNNEKGSGLGLVLCKDFVRRNGGSISVESILEKGSKFIFTVPVKG